MAFELETYRRIVGFKKSDKKCCYDGDLEIWSNGKAEKARIHNGKGAWKLYSLASVYSPSKYEDDKLLFNQKFKQ